MIGVQMETIAHIPLIFDAGDIASRLRFDPTRAGHVSLNGLMGLAKELIGLRAIYDVAYIGAKGESSVEVAGVTFESPILLRNLEKTNKVFPYIITAGPDLEREAGVRGDLLEQYYLEELANLALEQAAGWLAGRIGERFGLGPLSNMSPGSLQDWPITEQAKLFSVFGDTESLVGVRLSDSLLMVPRKSISGIFFPSEEGFVACQLCDRERCPGRKAPQSGVGPR